MTSLEKRLAILVETLPVHKEGKIERLMLNSTGLDLGFAVWAWGFSIPGWGLKLSVQKKDEGFCPSPHFLDSFSTGFVLLFHSQELLGALAALCF